MDFKHQLAITLLDKGLLALVVLFAGFWLNKAIEQIRSTNALKADLAKMRDSRNLDYWEKQLSEFYWPLYVRLQYDNAVWRRILDAKEGNDGIRRKLGREIERTFVLPNHEEIVRIIRSNMHLMENDGIALDAMLRYIRHVAVYKAMRLAGVEDQFPDALGEPWPRDLFPQIEKMAYRLQARYDEAVRAAGADVYA
jgi:hypothetical protein